MGLGLNEWLEGMVGACIDHLERSRTHGESKLNKH